MKHIGYSFLSSFCCPLTAGFAVAILGQQSLHATRLTFDADKANNTYIAENYGSNIASDSVEFVTTDGSGTTPNLILVWDTTKAFQHHGADNTFWDHLDEGEESHVMQLEQLYAPITGDAQSITFCPSPGVALVLNSLRIGNATNQTEDPYYWQINVKRCSDGKEVLAKQTSYTNYGDDQHVEIVEFAFTGEPGVSYRLTFASNGGIANRTAIDDLSFSQVGSPIPPRVIGHRGNSLFAPENTLVSFAQAAETADYVELDVRATSDNKLVVIHDDTVGRTTNGGNSAVADLTLAEIQQLEAGYWFSDPSYDYSGQLVPTLRASIECILDRNAIPLIERKAGGADLYVALLQELELTTSVVLMSFDWDFLKNVHDLDETIPLVALGSGSITGTKLDEIITCGAYGISWDNSDVNLTGLALARSKGLKVYVWKVDGGALQTFVDIGVDGITTSNPSLAWNLTHLTPVSNAALAKGLVSYWKLDDGCKDAMATTAADVEATNHGTLNGFGTSPTWLFDADAKHGGALSFDGKSDSVAIPRSASLDIKTNAVTVAAWVKLLGSNSGFSGIYDSEQDSYVLYLDEEDEQLRFKITDNTGCFARPGIPSALLSSGAWHHVVGVYDGSAGLLAGQATIYLDGRLIDAHTPASHNLVGLVKLGQVAAMGKNGEGDEYWFSGGIDDLAVWNRALSAAEIVQLYNGDSLESQVISLRITEFSYPTVVPGEGWADLRMTVQVAHAAVESGDLIFTHSDDLVTILPDHDSPFTSTEDDVQINKVQVEGVDVPGQFEVLFDSNYDGPYPKRFFRVELKP